MTRIDLAVLDLASGMGGVVHRDDLDGIGVSAGQRLRLVRSGLLRRVTPAVYLVRGTPDGWRERVRVAVRQAGTEAVASHGTAAVLWALPRIGPGAVEVTTPRWVSRPRETIGRVHHTALRLQPVPAPMLGIPVTDPVRTILDLGARLGRAHLTECVQDLCRRDLMTIERFATALDEWRSRGRPGVQHLEEVARAVSPLPDTDSWLEALFVRLIARAGLELPDTQVILDVGSRRYRVDALWSERHLVVELNGHATHATRRRLSEDAERSARLQAAGFEVLTFTFDQVVDQPAYVSPRSLAASRVRRSPDGRAVISPRMTGSGRIDAENRRVRAPVLPAGRRAQHRRRGMRLRAPHVFGGGGGARR